MAFKMTRDEKKERDELLVRLRETREAAASAISDYNDALEPLKAWRDVLVERIEGEMEEKSQRWQEGEKAQAVSSWLDTIRDVDMEEFEELSEPFVDEQIAELQNEPEE